MSELRTAAFRKQHEGIIEIVDNILTSLEPEVLLNNTHGIRKLITKLSNNVKVHLVLEDSALYPILANSENEKVRATSKQFMEEMGVISKSYGDHVDKWSTCMKIKEKTTEDIVQKVRQAESPKQRSTVYMKKWMT